jgi:hypothetical protein
VSSLTPGNKTRGFVLVTAVASIAGLLALTGLAVDAGRLYIVRSELQVYADEAAIAAAFELDGTLAGLNRARDLANSGPVAGASRNRWNFATELVTGAQAQFAASAEGPFESNPASPAALRFVRVQASASVRNYLLALAPGISNTSNLTAASVAGQVRRTSLGNGIAPFAPTAHDVSDPEFGYTRGEMYTLRWAPEGARDKEDGRCPGDATFDPGSSSERGYIDVGQGAGASALRDTVVSNSYFLDTPISLGTILTPYPGQQSVPSAVEARFAQDTDVAAQTYSEYAGNGRRLFTVAVAAPGEPAAVVGFAAFFLRPQPCGIKNTNPCCAEYVGPAVTGGSHVAAGPSGLYEVELVR